MVLSQIQGLAWRRDQACMTASAHCEVNANENIWPCKQVTVSTQFRAGTGSDTVQWTIAARDYQI